MSRGGGGARRRDVGRARHRRCLRPRACTSTALHGRRRDRARARARARELAGEGTIVTRARSRTLDAPPRRRGRARRRRARDVRADRPDLRPAQPAAVGGDRPALAGARRRASSARAPAGPVLDLCAGTMDLTAARRARAPERPRSSRSTSPRRCSTPAGTRRRAPRSSSPTRTRSRSTDGEFAAVVCGFGVRNLADPGAAVREVLRVLRPGGVFVTLELFRPDAPATRAFPPRLRERRPPGRGRLALGRPRRVPVPRREHGGLLSTRRSTSGARAEPASRACRGRDLTLGVASIVRARGGTDEARRSSSASPARAARLTRERLRRRCCGTRDGRGARRLRLADGAGGVGARVRRRPARGARRSRLGHARLQGAVRERQRRAGTRWPSSRARWAPPRGSRTASPTRC